VPGQCRDLVGDEIRQRRQTGWEGSVRQARPLNVLVTTSPVLSRLWDVVPIAWALRSYGHDVRVATLPALTPAVVNTGLTALPAGPSTDVQALGLDGPAETDDQVADLGRAHGQVASLLAAGLLSLVDHFTPDLIVHEPADLAGPLLAQRLGVPCVQQSCGPPRRDQVLEALHQAAVGLRRELGLDTAVPRAALVLDVCPPCLQVAYPDSTPVQAMRYVPFNGAGAAPDWLFEQPARPRACVALGATGPAAGDLPLLARVAGALSGLDLEVVLPLGAEHAADLDVGGPNVRVVDWLPLKFLAESCDLVVHQGSPGTTLTMLGFGVPQLVIPARWDQRDIADLVQKCGAGLRIDSEAATEDDLRQAGGSLLGDSPYRRAARAAAAEVAGQPTPLQAAAALAQLAAAGPA
jgi:UDP:flavonoid glycosyltransferase YjiC (YdhE family)